MSARADALLAALEVVLRDVATDTPVRSVRLEVGEQGGDELVWARHPGGSTGFWVRDERGEELLVRAADEMQDQLFDQLAETWGRALPLCPGHQHPLDPVLDDDEAWWRCPRDDRRVGRIGRLGADPA